MTKASASHTFLKRELGIRGAAMMGLGSMIGTGVFVSIGVAAGVAGAGVIIATAIAAFVAICNGLSSAQLAAKHPVAGGTYEYGYRWLNSYFGFAAGFLFLLAKSASAATAALGFGGYLVSGFGLGNEKSIVPVALTVVAVLTAIVMAGIRNSSRFNVLVVSIAVLSLLFFIFVGATHVKEDNFFPFFSSPAENNPGNPLAMLLHASALMFVAFTGYGRIATLGEEVREPEKTIPRAIIAALFATTLIYIGVAFTAIGSVGASGFFETTDQHVAPLAIVASKFDFPGADSIVAAGALAAMLGVLINLLLGLSRMAMALGRRRDLPGVFATLNAAQTTPILAVGIVGLLVAALVLIGDVRITWSFSAFTVLIYYSITNLAVLRMKRDERIFPRSIAWTGLVACLFLAFWVEPEIWITGLTLLGAGLIWHSICRQFRKRNGQTPVDESITK